MLTIDKPVREVVANGVVLVFGDGENLCFGIAVSEQRTSRLLRVEVDHLGRLMKSDFFNCLNPYRDALSLPWEECMVRVYEGERLLVQLGHQPQGHLYQPWMVWQGEQAFVTENYVSIPPALRIVDATGALWTLGFERAPKELSPEGEYAFEVLRDGLPMGAIASRIECRNGNMRVFTKDGFKRWLGREWS